MPPKKADKAKPAKKENEEAKMVKIALRAFKGKGLFSRVEAATCISALFAQMTSKNSLPQDLAYEKLLRDDREAKGQFTRDEMEKAMWGLIDDIKHRKILQKILTEEHITHEDVNNSKLALQTAQTFEDLQSEPVSLDVLVASKLGPGSAVYQLMNWAVALGPDNPIMPRFADSTGLTGSLAIKSLALYPLPGQMVHVLRSGLRCQTTDAIASLAAAEILVDTVRADNLHFIKLYFERAREATEVSGEFFRGMPSLFPPYSVRLNPGVSFVRLHAVFHRIATSMKMTLRTELAYDMYLNAFDKMLQLFTSQPQSVQASPQAQFDQDLLKIARMAVKIVKDEQWVIIDEADKIYGADRECDATIIQGRVLEAGATSAWDKFTANEVALAKVLASLAQISAKNCWLSAPFDERGSRSNIVQMAESSSKRGGVKNLVVAIIHWAGKNNVELAQDMGLDGSWKSLDDLLPWFERRYVVRSTVHMVARNCV